MRSTADTAAAAMHGLKYQLLPVLMAAAWLCARTCSHAGPAQPRAPAGYLWFTIEKHPGKSDWVSCSLDLGGRYQVLDEGMVTASGWLSEHESHRILQEYEKLCTTLGEWQFPPDPLLGNGGNGGIPPPPCFFYLNPQGKRLELQGPQARMPPELTNFMRILWQKLLANATQNPPPAPSIPAPAPPIPAALR